MRYAALILILLSGCGSKEGPPVPVVSDNEAVSVREMLEVSLTDCYKQTITFEKEENEKATAELLAASAGKSTLMEYLVTSSVRAAEFDLEICQLHAQCYDISDDKRTMYVVSCIGQREQHRNAMADL